MGKKTVDLFQESTSEYIHVKLKASDIRNMLGTYEGPFNADELPVVYKNDYLVTYWQTITDELTEEV